MFCRNYFEKKVYYNEDKNIFCYVYFLYVNNLLELFKMKYIEVVV